MRLDESEYDSEEVKKPAPEFTAAIIIAIGGITVLYTLFNYSIYRVFSIDELKHSLTAEILSGHEVAKLLLGSAVVFW